MSLHQSVIDNFVHVTIGFEGALSFMYLDVKGLVTTGDGNLIDPFSMAAGLKWRKADGSLASHAEIQAEWGHIKALQSCALYGGGWFKRVASLHLDQDAIDELVAGKRDLNASILASRFPGFADWPADAQMATMSMAWACGAGFHFPKLEAALNAQDWETAAQECHMEDSKNPGLRPRNKADVQMFNNAHAVSVASGQLDPDELYYPRVLTVSVEPVVVTPTPVVAPPDSFQLIDLGSEAFDADGDEEHTNK